MANRKDFTSISVHNYTKVSLENIKEEMEKIAGFKLSLNDVIEGLIDIYFVKQQ